MQNIEKSQTKNLNAIILAAGLGSRLRPITDNKPKCLLEVGGKILLAHQLTAIKKAGLQSATIVTGHFHEQVEAFVQSNFPGDPIRLCRNNLYQTTNNAWSLGLALKENEGAFLLLDGDLLFDQKLLNELAVSKDENLFVVDARPNGLTDEAMKVSLNQAGQIVRFSKELPMAEAAGEYIGMARLGGAWSRQLSRGIEKMNDAMQKTAYYEDIINPLILSSPPILAMPVGNNRWTEIDTPEDLGAATLFFCEETR